MNNLFLTNDINSTSKDTFISKFLNDLRNCLEKYRSYDLFKQLPQTTYFHLTGYSGNFLECMAYSEKKLYYVPKDILSGKLPKLGEALTYNSSHKLVVNYGGIPLWENEISKFKSECSVAK